MDIKVGNYVTRITHHHDMIFKVLDIDGDICYLKGANVRLYADSDIDDLVKKIDAKIAEIEKEEELAKEKKESDDVSVKDLVLMGDELPKYDFNSLNVSIGGGE